MSTTRRPRPVTKDDERQLAELHAQGVTAYRAAKIMQRSPRTITELARKLGLTWARTAHTAAAAQAHRLDARARRAALALALLEDAEKLRARMWQPGIVYNIGGRDNVYTDHPVEEPPAADKRHLIHAAAIAIDRSIRLDEYDRDNGADAAKSMLGSLAAGLQAAYRQLEHADQAGADGAPADAADGKPDDDQP